MTTGMDQFRLWAPRADHAAIQFDGRKIPLDRGSDGYFFSSLPGLTHGTEYSLRLNHGSPLPDPRSASQPRGPHGPSQFIDHSRFLWTDGAWQPQPLRAAVFYELHIGTFTPGGTFDSALARLSHLVKLGITHVEIMPVADFPGERGWGYDGVNLFAPFHCYGGPDGLKRFVDACHSHGLAAVLDVVYNHLGPDGNYLELFGPYFTARHKTPWGDAVNLDDEGSTEVRRFLIDNALMWFRDYHFDALRVDAIHAFFDSSPVHFFAQLTAEVDNLERSLGRPLVVIAESCLNDPCVVLPREAGGHGFHAQWNDDFHHSLHTAFTGETQGYYRGFDRPDLVQRAFTTPFLREGAKTDEPVEIPGDRFLVYLQNHDQVGNRAIGDRLAHLVPTDGVMAAAAALLLSPYVPMLFQGEEWGASTPFPFFADHIEEHIQRSVRAGRIEEFAAFGWRAEDIPDPQAEETFRRAKLNWEELSMEPHRSILEWHRKLIALRRQTAAEQVKANQVGTILEVVRGSVRAEIDMANRQVRLTAPR